MSRSEIAANNARFCSALGDHDMDRVMELHDPDISLLITGAPPIRGHEGVRAYYGNVFAAGVSGAEMRTLKLEEVGDTLVEVGEYTMGRRSP
jgi:ketosteroid isomerase-like protein